MIDSRYSIINMDCLSWMKLQSANLIDCIITDPPYGLKFMGKKWDYQIPSIEIWHELLRICKPGSWMLCFGGTRTYHRMTCNIEDAGWEIRDCLMWLYGSGFPKGKGCLKPAYEPIVLARKKTSKPELNIDECRINNPISKSESRKSKCGTGFWNQGNERAKNDGEQRHNLKGRWPANIILDEEAGEMLDEQTGILKSGSGDKHFKTQDKSYNGGFKPLSGLREYKADSEGASRFFYCPKASPFERQGSIHPTMKPIRLMEYLIKLIVSKDGILLDPFAGSGTTILAAKNLGYKAIGIELEKEYCDIAIARLTKSNQQMKLNI